MTTSASLGGRFLDWIVREVRTPALLIRRRFHCPLTKISEPIRTTNLLAHNEVLEREKPDRKIDH